MVLHLDLGEIDEAMKLLEYEQDRFSLVQRFFSQLLKYDETRSLQLYVKHLMQALERARYPEVQSMIIRSAMNCEGSMNRIDARLVKEHLQSVLKNDGRYNGFLNETPVMARAI